MTKRERYALYPSNTICPRFDVRSDILIDALEGHAVVPKMGGSAEVQVMYVSCETCAKAERECGLKVSDLRKAFKSVKVRGM